MSNCLCLACDRVNSLITKFCTQCGAKLQIQERYRALRVIGQGGFGKTFLAQDESKPSQPRCVIKQFSYNDNPSALQKALELFAQEAVHLAALGKHSQIPELLLHCEQEGKQYLVQEFIDGENLLQESNTAGRFSEAKIKELLLDLLPVLQFIHAGKVIHRDIKPENIIRRHSDGKLVLVDFGSAKIASKTALAKTGTKIGSPEYTAPEQASGKAVFASDIYGLGVTCIYLLTQISPFDLYSDHDGAWVWRQFLNGDVVSNELGVVLDKMIEKATKRRYKDVDNLTKALLDISPPQKSPSSLQPNFSQSQKNQVKTLIPTTPNKVVQPNSLPKPLIIRGHHLLSTRRRFLALLGLTGGSALSVFAWEHFKPREIKTSTDINITVDDKGIVVSRKKSMVQYFTESSLNLPSNATSLEMAIIPKGKFLMGSPNTEKQHLYFETPQHEVEFPKEFYMGRYAITQAQWLAVMGKFPDDFNKRFFSEQQYLELKGDNRPMIGVSVYEIDEFCKKLNFISFGRGTYRLPTEAEWEYACRAGTTTPFHFGETITADLAKYNEFYPYANVPVPKSEKRSLLTVDVNSFYPNKWGLYQMHGNIDECCLSDGDYSKKTDILKKNGSETWRDPNKIESGYSLYSLRGGDFRSDAKNCRSSSRFWYNVLFYSSSWFGFRIVFFPA